MEMTSTGEVIEAVPVMFDGLPGRVCIGKRDMAGCPTWWSLWKSTGGGTVSLEDGKWVRLDDDGNPMPGAAKGAGMTDDRPYMVLLNSDGWRNVAEYVPSRDYVYVRGYAFMAKHPGVGIARRGKYDNSGWWRPNGEPLPLDVCWWKPFPTDDGISPHQRWLDFIRPSDGTYVRPPEEMFEPAGVDAKLTPVPRKLLMDMHGGVVLHESAWRWTVWTLRDAGEPSDRISERGVNRLRECAFIERDGVLPPGRLPHWFEFNWKITAAGKAWIEANTGEKL